MLLWVEDPCFNAWVLIITQPPEDDLRVSGQTAQSVSLRTLMELTICFWNTCTGRGAPEKYQQIRFSAFQALEGQANQRQTSLHANCPSRRSAAK